MTIEEKRHFRYKEISLKEIQISGIIFTEFTSFLESNGATEVFNAEKHLATL